VATAYAANEAGLKSVGIIRGEKLPQLSKTLLNATTFGMQLIFVTREAYRDKVQLQQQFDEPGYLWLGEGGYGATGAKGAAEIGKLYNLNNYTLIVAAVGTGTMLAGLILSANATQEVIGISAMKGNEQLERQIKEMIAPASTSTFTILHSYHFGGFGKHPQALIDSMNDSYQQYHLPLDIVYTGKTFYAIKDLAEKGYFSNRDKIVMIHSGGLQGNRSLGEKVLAF